MKELDIYDIIVEKLTGEWHFSMDNNWEQPKFTRKQIERAGKCVIDLNATDEEKEQAVDILNNWRSSHAYPIQVIGDELRQLNQNAIIARRLKRLESITGKLERFPEMSLYKMQDLGGCRVIVDTIEQVYEALEKYKSSGISHILKKENDYIQKPKISGYRSYHVVYQFQSKDKDVYNKGILIEIQFRTKLQHIWATAVEIMGIYTKSQLKSSKGDERILRFFTLSSSIFALQENTPVCPGTPSEYSDIIHEMKQLNKELNIVDKLSAISLAIKHTDNVMQEQGYYLLQLDYENRGLRVTGFEISQIELATRIYNSLEKQNNLNRDTVLVAAESFSTLQEAYQNYFTDISQFVKLMKQLLANDNSLAKISIF